ADDMAGEIPRRTERQAEEGPLAIRRALLAHPEADVRDRVAAQVDRLRERTDAERAGGGKLKRAAAGRRKRPRPRQAFGIDQEGGRRIAVVFRFLGRPQPPGTAPSGAARGLAGLPRARGILEAL